MLRQSGGYLEPEFKMNEMKHKQRALLWGILIGGSLGFMESCIAIRLWHEFGAPDFLVRPHELSLHTICNTTGGILCGLIFGSIIGTTSERRTSSIRFFPFYLSLLFLGSLLFAGQYWVTLRFRLPLWFLGDAVLFTGGLLLARAFANRANPEPCITKVSP